jgi:hypothetical protein
LRNPEERQNGTTILWKTISPTDRGKPRKLKKPKALQR